MYREERKTAGELRVIGEQHGWKARKLSMAEVQRMGSTELTWHEKFNVDNLKKAYADAKAPEPKAPPLEKQKEFAEKMFQEYPQLVRSDANAAEVDAWLAKMPKPTFTFADFEQAVDTLASEGRLELDLRPLGLGDGTISGYAVRNHPQIRKLCSRAHPLSEAAKKKNQYRPDLTSDEFKKEHRYAWVDTEGTPSEKSVTHEQRGAIIGRIKHIFEEFMAQEPRYTNTDANAEIMYQQMKSAGLPYNVANLNAVFRGLLSAKAINAGEPVFDKAAFRREIADMPSAEYERRRRDPVFRMKADCA